jgi:hypothetical protein
VFSVEVLHDGIVCEQQANRLERQEIARNKSVQEGYNVLGGAPKRKGFKLGRA